MTSPFLPKPAYGAPCNNCGRCCVDALCWIGRLILGPQVKSPCPALIDTAAGRELFCGLMVNPQDYLPEQAKIVGAEAMCAAAKALIGAGDGCSLRYPHEPENPAFKRQSGLRKLTRKRIIKLLAVLGIGYPQAIAFLKQRGL